MDRRSEARKRTTQARQIAALPPDETLPCGCAWRTITPANQHLSKPFRRSRQGGFRKGQDRPYAMRGLFVRRGCPVHDVEDAG